MRRPIVDSPIVLIIKRCLEERVKKIRERNKYWDESIFQEFTTTGKGDDVGYLGEEVLYYITTEYMGMKVKWDADKNTVSSKTNKKNKGFVDSTENSTEDKEEESTYDMICYYDKENDVVFMKRIDNSSSEDEDEDEGNKVENKASGWSEKYQKWQHDSIKLKEGNWQKLMLFDYAYDSIYFSVVDFEDLNPDCKHPIFGNTPHKRRNGSDQYKWDFGPVQIKRGLKSGLTFHYDLTAPDDEALAQFIKDKLFCR